ncbi:MAG: hypothetical protein WCI54_11575 [Bacteroidia bacterium]|jgi:hypothetical protein
MEKKIGQVAKKEIENFGTKKISRKDAIRRTGYIAASAATMMILLSNQSKANGPNTSQCAPPPKKTDGDRGGSGIWKK